LGEIICRALSEIFAVRSQNITGITILSHQLKNMVPLTGLQRRHMKLYIKMPLKNPIEPVISANQRIKWLKRLVLILWHILILQVH